MCRLDCLPVPLLAGLPAGFDGLQAPRRGQLAVTSLGSFQSAVMPCPKNIRRRSDKVKLAPEDEVTVRFTVMPDGQVSEGPS